MLRKTERSEGLWSIIESSTEEILKNCKKIIVKTTGKCTQTYSHE